jgi:hypothetical protein
MFLMWAIFLWNFRVHVWFPLINLACNAFFVLISQWLAKNMTKKSDKSVMLTSVVGPTLGNLLSVNCFWQQ